ncbi:hypothetical protein DKL61_09125 [Gammaproteobacteria bacterium ESL0073]|nr:hypothetical protein DKL61_09125 [Gammaproteobacteria bacterium ESL0073]
MAMAQRFLTIENGQKKSKEALLSSSGAADAGKIPALNNEGKIDKTMLPDSAETADIVKASESLTAGSFVNLFKDETGVISVRLADNTNNREAHGFVKQAATAGESVGFYSLGIINPELSGLVVGQRCYLGVTGKIIQTPLDESLSSNKGYISQYLGIAKSDKEILTLQEDSITL